MQKVCIILCALQYKDDKTSTRPGISYILLLMKYPDTSRISTKCTLSGRSTCPAWLHGHCC